ncbi:MAG: AAA family ATPase [Gammaproteobacteria bacterium]|jgi:predicted ATPase|nr:AAA family ATPase [Gammaproteobacteria bacterium]MBT4492356.1 AAA family ATPase [Gammaproteobacteria bacterium]MBT7371772.1 AAA family ATPase [Gammaproteobacteria bacterium]
MFLRSIEFNAESLPDEYPFTVPIIQSLQELNVDHPVTFLVGENGCGKSTLLEAIACGLNCPAVGAADVQRDPMLETARKLSASLRLVRRSNPKVKLFFRAEDAIGFTRSVQANLDSLAELESTFDESLDGFGRDLAVGAIRGQHSALTSRYGNNPDARSHGEWFINLIRERIHSKGLYLLDEPETPLSPIHQLTLLSIIKETTALGAQFIIATHSPILMASPGATIYSLDGMTIEKKAWEEVEHVALTKAFLADPESFLRHL